MRILWVVAVPREAEALRDAGGEVVVAGIGRTNAACATTETLLRRGPFDAVVSAGIAGSLPGSGLAIGELVVATACVYAEEGLAAPDGFHDVAALRFPLGDFTGNAVPVEAALAAVAPAGSRRGAIATVATCSGTDAAAEEVARRTGALAEAMEGAAVVHAARRLGVPAAEVRAISNSTGERPRQRWDLAAAFTSLARLRVPAGPLPGVRTPS